MKKQKEEGPDYYNDQTGSVKFDRFWMALYERVIELLPNSMIADLGCSVGRFTNLLHKRGYKNLWGIDFSKSRVAIARKLVPDANFLVGNLYDKSLWRKYKH